MKNALIAILIFISPTLQSQSLLAVRGIGMGSDIATAVDLSSLFSNPAGLSSVRDLQINNTNGFITSTSGQGIFGSVGVAHRFLNTHVAAFVYAPSRVLNFNFIEQISREINGPADKEIFTDISDTRLRYQETIRLGYGYRPVPGLSFGLSSQLQREDIEEKLTSIHTKENISSTTRFSREFFTASAWNFDAGALYSIHPSIQLGIVAHNFLSIRESSLPDKFRYYSLLPEKTIRFGASVRPVEDFLLSGEIDTKRRGTLGFELNAYSPTTPFVLRGALWMDSSLYALSTGVGYTYKFITFDASYLLFIDKHLRGSPISESQFSPISNIEINRYTPDRFSISVSIALGSLRDAVARLERVEISSPIFPSSYRIHATRPLGYARVRNLTNEPIQVKLRVNVRKLMDLPTETGAFYLEPQEVKDIPFTVEFNESILSIRNESLRETEIGVIASQIDNYEDVLKAKLLIHGRNSWNGDPLTLKYFVTPSDPSVVKFTRKAISENRDYIESAISQRQRLEQARTVFNKLANLLTYVADPRTYDVANELESVQYPAETLDLRGGDCDDLTVCYCSLLNSLGFETAFVDVSTAEGNTAHLYLLFDTGVLSTEWPSITNNEKKIVLRKNSSGTETVWIPIETTIITAGFDAAWDKGALEYLNDVDLSLGLLRGTVKIIDVYQPE